MVTYVQILTLDLCPKLEHPILRGILRKIMRLFFHTICFVQSRMLKSLSTEKHEKQTKTGCDNKN